MLDRKYFDKLHKEVLANNKSPELTVANSGKAIDGAYQFIPCIEWDTLLTRVYLFISEMETIYIRRHGRY